jgi:hypothetical protein
MKRFVFSIALSNLMFVAICGTAKRRPIITDITTTGTTAILPRPIGTITALTGLDEVMTRSQPDSYHPPMTSGSLTEFSAGIGCSLLLCAHPTVARVEGPVAGSLGGHLPGLLFLIIPDRSGMREAPISPGAPAEPDLKPD